MFSAAKTIKTSLEEIHYGTFQKLHPLGLLRQLANCYDNTCLQVLSNRVSWSIYLEQGKIIYATHSVEPLERLDRHLHRLAAQIPTLSSSIRIQLRLMLEEDCPNQLTEHPDYQGIHWLVEQQYLCVEQAALLIQEMVKEVIESFLLIQHGSYELTNQLHTIPKICRLNVEKIIKICQDKLQVWQSMGTKISSPYQRPYLWNAAQVTKANLTTDELDLTHWTKGLSIRHLAVITNKDELELASNIYLDIIRGIIVLHEPDPPFDRLPKIVTDKPETNSGVTHPEDSPMTNPTDLTDGDTEQREQWIGHRQDPVPRQQQQSTTAADDFQPDEYQITPLDLDRKKVYTIVAVDNNPAILQQISQFLVNDMFSTVTINQPVKTPMSIICHRPDLILLDLNMAEMDGYELCRLIRKEPMFKNTPIVIMTASKGIIDGVKARMVGASGSFTKPFNRVNLLKMVFSYLT